MNNCFLRMCALFLVLIAASANGQSVIIDDGLDISSQQVVAFIDFYVDNNNGYDHTEFDGLELYENNGLWPVDTDSGNFDDTNQLGGGFWGGGWDATDNSVQAGSQYCYFSQGGIFDSDFGETPVSLSFNKCGQTPPVPGPTSIGNVIFLGCHQPGCALWQFSYSSAYATQYRIQSKPVGYGSWTTFEVTSSTSYYPHLASNAKAWRIRGENSSGNGPWSSTFYTSGECNGGGGPID